LLSLWGVGEAIVEAVAFHHRPSVCGLTEFTPLTAVHVANALHEQSQAVDEQKAALEPDAEFLAKTGLSEHLSKWRELVQAV
jgi:hypothetical protein